MSTLRKFLFERDSRHFFYFWFTCLLLGVPSYLCWPRSPFIITLHEFDFLLGLVPGTGEQAPLWILMLGRCFHTGLILAMGYFYLRICYLVLLNQDVIGWKEIVWAVGLSMGVSSFYIPWLSPDVFFYFGTGWIDAHWGMDPYRSVISEAPDFGENPIYRNIFPAWDQITTPYGPLLVKLFSFVVLIGRNDDRVCLMVLKVFFFAVHVLNGWLVYKIAKQLTMKAKAVCLLFLINPALLICFIGRAHNDIMLMTCLLASVLFLVRGQAYLTMLSLGVGVGIKYFPLLIFPYFLLYFFKGDFSFKSLLRIGLLIMIFVGISILPSFFYEGGISNFYRLLVGRNQLMLNFSYWFSYMSLYACGIDNLQLVKMLFKGCFVILYGFIGLRMLLMRDKLTVDDLFAHVIVMMLIYFVVGSPEIHEWYIGWFLALIWWTNRRAYFVIAMVLVIAVNAAVIHTGRGFVAVSNLTWAGIFLLLWWCLYYIWKRYRSRKMEGSPLFL